MLYHWYTFKNSRIFSPSLSLLRPWIIYRRLAGGAQAAVGAAVNKAQSAAAQAAAQAAAKEVEKQFSNVLGAALGGGRKK